MMTTPEEVAAAFAGTPLGLLPTGHGPAGTILVRDVAPDGLVEAWRAAHRRMPVTGRWPVMVTDEFDQWAPDIWPQSNTPASLEVLLADLEHKTQIVDVSASLTGEDQTLTEADEVVFFARGCYTDVNLSAEALERFALPTTMRTVEKWAYQRVLSDPELVRKVRRDARWAVQTGNWYTPERVWLVLLPTSSPWLAPYWVDFYGFGGGEELAAVLRQWYERYDAYLVADWYTMLQLLVDRPPKAAEESWTLAGQMLELTTHLEAHQWELAVTLPESEAWFLHNRP